MVEDLSRLDIGHRTLVNDLHRDKTEPRLDRFQGSEKDYCPRRPRAITVAFPLHYSQHSPSTFHSFSIEAEELVSIDSDASYLSASLIVLMSTAHDVRRRPGLWSYFSFGSPPHRRIVSSPERQGLGRQEKEDSPTRAWGGRGRADTLEGYRTEPVPMTGGRRSRYLKTGGVVTLILFLLYLFSSRDNVNVRNIVQGLYKQLLCRTTTLLMFLSRPSTKSNDYNGNRESDRSFTRDDEVLKVQFQG